MALPVRLCTGCMGYLGKGKVIGLGAVSLGTYEKTV